MRLKRGQDTVEEEEPVKRTRGSAAAAPPAPVETAAQKKKREDAERKAKEVEAANKAKEAEKKRLEAEAKKKAEAEAKKLADQKKKDDAAKAAAEEAKKKEDAERKKKEDAERKKKEDDEKAKKMSEAAAKAVKDIAGIAARAPGSPARGPGSPMNKATAAGAAAAAISAVGAAPAAGPSSPMVKAVVAAAALAANNMPRMDATDADRSAWAAKGGLKKGPFSQRENEILKDAFDEYCKRHDLTEEDKSNMIESRKHSRKYRGVWQQIAERLPERSILSIYDHCSRHFHRGNYSGKWKEDEVNSLRQLVAAHGRDWKTIGTALNRLPCTCRDKWREIQHNPNKGTWSDAEDERLLNIIRKHQGVDDNKKLLLKPMLWSTIAAEMENTRTPLACRAAWVRLYSKLCCPELSANTPEFDNDLIKKLSELGADHKSEIRWSGLSPLWPGRRCRVRFDQLRKSIDGNETMSFGELIQKLHERFLVQKNLGGGSAMFSSHAHILPDGGERHLDH